MSIRSEELSPREIIQQLDIEEIDAAIEDLKGELSALQSLRKVASAKNGKTTGGRGNSRVSAPVVKMTKAERADFAKQIIAEFGPTTYHKIAERAGYEPSKAFWMLKAIEGDSRFSVDADGETVRLN